MKPAASLLGTLVVTALSTTGPGCTGESGEPVFSADVESVHLSAFGYHGGAFEWESPTARLSEGVRQALKGLRPVEPKDTCGADRKEAQLTLRHADGNVTAWRSVEGDAACFPGTPKLAYETIKPLLARLGCVATGAVTSKEMAPTIRPGDGCRHGFSSFRDQEPHWMKLVIEDASRPHAVRTLQCAGKETALEIFDAAGTTKLAEAAPTVGDAAGGCAAVTHTFASAGSYLVKLTSRAVTTGGHVFFEAVPAP